MEWYFDIGQDNIQDYTVKKIRDTARKRFGETFDETIPFVEQSGKTAGESYIEPP